MWRSAPPLGPRVPAGVRECAPVCLGGLERGTAAAYGHLLEFLSPEAVTTTFSSPDVRAHITTQPE